MLRRWLARTMDQSTKDRVKVTLRKSAERAPRPVLNGLLSYRSWRRFRSPSTVLSRLANHPAVVYGLLSDPQAVEKLIGSDKAQQILWSRRSSDEPGVEHVLALLASQPDRLAALLSDREVQDKMIQTGLMFRSDLEWLGRATAMHDPRAVDSLIDMIRGPEELLLAGPARSLLVEYLAVAKDDSARLKSLLCDIEHRRPGTVSGALTPAMMKRPATMKGA
jgi:hypothetical protein